MLIRVELVVPSSCEDTFPQVSHLPVPADIDIKEFGWRDVCTVPTHALSKGTRASGSSETNTGAVGRLSVVR